MSYTFRLNGTDETVEAPAEQTLLELLRDQLRLLSVREGCGIGVCGACTVLVDGRPISSCLTLAAMVEGRDVLTVEGLGMPAVDSEPSALDPLQEAFVACSGFQCAYCTPGFILTTKALLAEQPNATDEEIREYLAGNLCRCGSYVKILDSVRAAIKQLR